MKFSKIFFVTLSLLSANSFAFMCPSTFNQIDFGDTLAQVEQACGKADKTVKTEAEDNTPQEWSYYLPQESPNPTFYQQQQTQGTAKTTFAFDAGGKVINITVNGMGVGSSNACGSQVSIGSTRKDIESACGKPTFVNKQNTSPLAQGKDDDANKQVELIYNSTPPITLIFRDGKLADKR